MNFDETYENTCSTVANAIRANKFEEFKKLIVLNYPVDVPDNRAWRPIHEAVATEDVKYLYELLLHGGSDPNWKSHEGETPLILACNQKNSGHALDCVQMLIDHGANPDLSDLEEETPLLLALRNRHINVVHYLLETANANVNIPDCGSWYPIHEAVLRGQVEQVQLLLAHGAMVDVKDECGITPLFAAAQEGHKNCIILLVEEAKRQGKDIQEFLDNRTKDQATALMIAVQQKFFDIAEYLLVLGSNANLYTEDFVSALHFTIQNNDVNCFKLVMKSVDLETLTYISTHSNPLKLGIEYNSFECIELLLKHGFPVDQPSPRSISFENIDFTMNLPNLDTALSYAHYKKNKIAIALLIKYGASRVPSSDDILHPLLLALVRFKREDLEKILLDYSYDLDYQRVETHSFDILLAAMFRHRVFNLILLHGADPMLCLQDPERLSHVLLSSSDHRLLQLERVKLWAMFCYNTGRLNAFLMLIMTNARKYCENKNFPEALWASTLQNHASPSPLSHICRYHLYRRLHLIHKSRLPKAIPHLGLPYILTSFLKYEPVYKPTSNHF